MGSKGKMTDYERRRLENIQRNNEMLAALKVRSKLNDLSAASASAKRTSGEIKSYKPGSVKKPKTETPLILRRSLRARGVPPDASTANGLDDDGVIDKQINKSRTMNSNSVPNVSPRKQGPIRMHDSFCGEDGLENKLSELVKGCSENVLLNGNGLISSDSVDVIKGSKSSKIGKQSWGHVEGLELKPENIARVVPGRIMSLRFFPTRDMQMVAVGNKFGDIGFWHVNGKDEDGHGIYLYHPHAGPVSGIVIDPFSVSKMYSSCYEGFIRMMDVEKGVFDMVYHSEYCIYSIALSPHDVNSLYFGEGKGGFNKWDVRTGKSSLSFDLHGDRINTIDFNSDTENIMATSSTDGTACIWDLRLMKKDKTTPLKIVKHKRAVHSAYFSPSGKFLATTSYDDKVGLTSGANYESTSMVHHYNQTGRWISTFRGIWGWDDSSIYIGNMKRGVDVISVDEGRLVSTLQSDILSAIPCRFDPHPYNVGVLASATSGGQVYIWTQP